MLFAPETDRKGRDLKPGDRVRIKTYPRGTAEGVVAISARGQQRLPDGTWAPALVVDVGGTTYPLISKGTIKLASTNMNKIANTTELQTELTYLASSCTPGVSREAMATKLRELADRVSPDTGQRHASHLGEVDLTSPVEGKATLLFDGPDIDSVNFVIPVGGVPQKWVDSWLKREFGERTRLVALASRYPRTTKTLQVTSTKYRVERESGDDVKLEITLSVKKPKSV